MYGFLAQLGAFTLYTIALLLLSGQTFSWKETRRRFYLGDHFYSTPTLLAIFCAVWISASTMLAYPVIFLQKGYVAFAAIVNGWMLGLSLLPIVVCKLRKRDVMSIPEWLESEFGDRRFRVMGGIVLLVLLMLQLVVQFKAFGGIAAYMLHIPSSFAAAALIYLFVLYTSFGGFPAVARSNILNFLLIAFGILIGLAGAIKLYGSPIRAHEMLFAADPDFLFHGGSLRQNLETLSFMLASACTVAVHPQFCNLFLSARNTTSALRVTVAAPFVLGALYAALTLICLVIRGHFSAVIPEDEGQLPVFLNSVLPLWASLPLMLAMLAATSGTANSVLLVASAAFCHDIMSVMQEKYTRARGPFADDHFLFTSRAVIVLIASLALLLCQLELPRIIWIAGVSWNLIAVFFFVPLILSFRNQPFRKQMFLLSIVFLALDVVLLAVFAMAPWNAAVLVIGAQFALYLTCCLWGRLRG